MIYRAKKNCKGYCLTKNRERVDIYKLNGIGINSNNAGANHVPILNNINDIQFNLGNSEIINTDLNLDGDA